MENYLITVIDPHLNVTVYHTMKPIQYQSIYYHKYKAQFIPAYKTLFISLNKAYWQWKRGVQDLDFLLRVIGEQCQRLTEKDWAKTKWQEVEGLKRTEVQVTYDDILIARFY
ncbi:hypothetical protein BWI93_27305 [Siphonobacter sp. BAB-5385]|uniref:hypothetical protein n=1 Tax=Siphonobacter sp. BAB-5385 TaxID=1864822 RepID=UPI000B9EAEA6|nr:hypothetical protein [Siphonobacter sp. BAB-5385]OZI05097.1 hypothetical protein BWI93_27305 [Siphonobacter sp. BAB-5385]